MNAQYWCQLCERNGLGSIDWGYVLVFGGLMVVDLLQGAMHTTMLKLHHVGCLAGHAYASLVAVAAFPYYFSGVVALELGSAATCVHALWPRNFPPSAMLTVMTISNLAAAFTVYRWNLAMAHGPYAWGRWICPATTCVLIIMRQKDADEVLRVASASVLKRR
jgi:hypothetical protein